eukprot:PhF_6_TR42921/c0_g1_i1/m.65073
MGKMNNRTMTRQKRKNLTRRKNQRKPLTAGKPVTKRKRRKKKRRSENLLLEVQETCPQQGLRCLHNLPSPKITCNSRKHPLRRRAGPMRKRNTFDHGWFDTTRCTTKRKSAASITLWICTMERLKICLPLLCKGMGLNLRPRMPLRYHPSHRLQ